MSDVDYTYYFDGKVTDEAVTKALLQIQQCLQEDRNALVEVSISSEGGSPSAGLRFYEDVTRMRRKQGLHINTRAAGYTGSIATIMLQAGELRRMGEASRLMLHPPGIENFTGDMLAMRERLHNFEVMFNQMLQIYGERGNGRGIRQNIYSHRKWYLNAAGAKLYGLVDEIV